MLVCARTRLSVICQKKYIGHIFSASKFPQKKLTYFSLFNKVLAKMIGRNILLKGKNLIANPGLQLVRQSHHDTGGIPGAVSYFSFESRRRFYRLLQQLQLCYIIDSIHSLCLPVYALYRICRSKSKTSIV